MPRTLLAFVLVAAAAPALAQNVIGENPVLAGTTTCGAFLRMDAPGQLQALAAVEPVGDALGTADPALARQWAAEVAAACAGDPERPLDDAARRALALD